MDRPDLNADQNAAVPAPPDPDWSDLVARFDCPEAQALVLMGSCARGDAGPFSDVDLVRFVADTDRAPPDAGSHLIRGRLVVVSDARPGEVEAAFVQPEVAVGSIAGLRSGRSLKDPNGYFARIQDRARAFIWDAGMQARANAYANREMVGWIEEVHKGLEGLRRGDTGRLLNAEFGLSWGLNRLVQVQRGVLLSGDNEFFQAVEDAVGADTTWARLRRQVFGVGTKSPLSLEERVASGLKLYVTTAELLVDIWEPPARAMIEETVELVRNELE